MTALRKFSLIAVLLSAVIGFASDVHCADTRSLGTALRLMFGDDIPDLSEQSNTILDADEFPKGREEINKILEKVLTRTSIGRRWCGEILRGDAKLIQFHTGASEVASRKIADGCRGDVRETTDSIMSNSREQSEPRKYHFFFLNGQKSIVDSWTTKNNQTILVVSGKKIDRLLLQNMIVHELAVYFDQKYLLIETAPGKILAAGIPIPAPQCVAERALTNPMIQFSLAALRAFEIEKQVAIELNQPQTIEALTRPFERLSCLGKVELTIRHLLPAGPYLWAQSRYFDRCVDKNEKSRPRYEVGLYTRYTHAEIREKVDADLNALQQATLNAGDLNESFCRFMTTPKTSGQMIHYSQGPRPRIGGW